MEHRRSGRFGGRILPVFAAAIAVMVTALIGGPAMADHGSSPVDWDETSLREVYTPADGYYSYAPSVIREDDTEWIWSCHNDEFRVIKDHIYLTKIVDGVVVDSRSVLQASPAPAWDSFHVCDPSVVAGSFSYQGTKYGLAMFYLGNDLDASAHNQVGVAFANRPEGPWVKLPQPVVTFERTDQWGAGQPTAVKMPGKPGTVLLAYTQGDTSTRAYAVSIDLKKAEKAKASAPTLLPTAGLTGTEGAPDYLNGFDLVYDKRGGRFLTVREQHPYPQDNPWWIGPSVQVAAIDADDLMRGRGSWTPAGDINESLTGFTRNHNAGFARDWQGHLIEKGSVTVVFTKSCSSLPTVDDQDWSQATCDSLYSYDLWSIDGELHKQR